MPSPPVNVTSSDVTPPAPLCIDAGDDRENTYLDLMRLKFQGAGRNRTAIEAFAHVVGSPAGTIVGHGRPGIILTGRGINFDFRRFPDQTQSISIVNTEIWEPHVKTLETPIKHLMLLGCHVGALTDGALLLWQLAKALGATVQAPLGWVVPDPAMGNPSLAPDGWQIADPTMKEPPKEKKVLRLTTPGRDAVQLLIWDGERFLPISFNAIRGARLSKQMPFRERTWDAEWTEPDAQALARHVAFDQPLVFRGPPASIVTGRVFLSYRFLGRDVTRQFLVHNDLLLEDTHAPGVFYEIVDPKILAI
jgi:hypothetical protein